MKVAQLGEEIADVAVGLQAGDQVVALGRISSNLERR
jgi:hypothetical protein